LEIIYSLLVYNLATGKKDCTSQFTVQFGKGQHISV